MCNRGFPPSYVKAVKSAIQRTRAPEDHEFTIVLQGYGTLNLIRRYFMILQPKIYQFNLKQILLQKVSCVVGLQT